MFIVPRLVRRFSLELACADRRFPHRPVRPLQRGKRSGQPQFPASLSERFRHVRPPFRYSRWRVPVAFPPVQHVQQAKSVRPFFQRTGRAERFEHGQPRCRRRRRFLRGRGRRPIVSHRFRNARSAHGVCKSNVECRPKSSRRCRMTQYDSPSPVFASTVALIPFGCFPVVSRLRVFLFRSKIVFRHVAVVFLRPRV